jgi:hypothetical protein
MSVEIGVTVAGEYPTLADAVTAIGSAERTLIIGKSRSITADLTIPKNIRLWFTSGSISVASGKVLTINGPITAPISQIFAGAGAVRFGGRVSTAQCDLLHWL